MTLSITPDQMAAAGSHIARTWGDYGYTVESIESPTHAVSLFHVRHFDGSRFIVPVDKWGNAGEAVDSHGYETPERTEALAKVVREMHARAVAP